MRAMDERISEHGLPISTATSNVLVMGKHKTFAGLLVVEWAFLIISIINILTTVILTTYRLVIVIQTDSSSPDFTFTILMLINAIFCMVYVVHGLLKERQYELYALVAAIVVVLGYCFIEYIVNVQHRTIIKLVRLIFVCVMAPIHITLTIIVARKFGWLEFKIIGASQAFHAMYKEAARFLDVLSFDFQVTVNFVVLVLENGTMISTADVITLSIGLPVSIFWVVLGSYSLRREQRFGTWLFAVICLVLPAYVIYKLTEVYTMLTMTKEQPASNSMVLVYSLIVSGALALLIRTIVILELFIVYKNFGKGLKERAFSAEANERTSLLAAPRRR